MQDCKENHRLQKLNKFLTDPEKELQSHALIDQKNSKAMQQYEKDILNTTIAFNDSLAIQQKLYNNCVNLKGQNILSKLTEREKLIQLTSLNKNVKKKEEAIRMLENDLKKSTEEYEKLKDKKTKEIHDDHAGIKAFKKAINAFTKYFGYSIKMGDTNEEDKYSVVITFIFNGSESKYPIQFVFHKATDSLIGLDAGTLMSAEQQAVLLERSKKTNNNGALFCTLRNVALKKHVL